MSKCETKETKPAITIKPRWLHEYDRLSEILDAMERYAVEGRSVHLDWVRELRDLIQWCHYRFTFESENKEVKDV